jgi:hypothetical protein
MLLLLLPQGQADLAVASPLIGRYLTSVLVSKIDASLPNSLRQGLFTLPNPNSGVVLLLVGLVGSLGVTDLRHEVVFLGKDKVSDTGQVGELGVGVDVHLDNTVLDGSVDLLLGRTGSTVEDEVSDMVSCCSPQYKYFGKTTTRLEWMSHQFDTSSLIATPSHNPSKGVDVITVPVS